MAELTPTTDEVAAAVAEVWADVAVLAATDEGMLLMADALDAYPVHEE